MTRRKNDSGKRPPGGGRKQAYGIGKQNERVTEALRLISSYKAADRRFRAGQELFSVGTPSDAIFILIEGWVFLYNVLENGRRQILHFAMPGAVLGSSLDPSAIATFGAQALTDVVASVIPHKALNSLAKKHPDISLQLARLISWDLG